MGKDIIDIVKEKEFIQLTVEERLELKELCSTEDEFNQMKNVLLNVEGIQYSNETPKQETKDSLDLLFSQSYPKASPLWYNSVLAVVIPKEKPIYRQPLVQLAAIALIIFMVIPFYQTDINNNQSQLAQNTRDGKNIVVDEMKPIESSVDDVIVDDNHVQNQTQTLTDEYAIELPSAMDVTMEPTSGFADAFAPGVDHPDGVFNGSVSDVAIAFSLSADQSVDLLDLLTSTF